MNENKIDFIICYNNDMYMQECMKYINRLHVPEGMTTEVLGIKGADSMTSGYNAAMQESDAKYKVYMHQDIFIVNQNFIQDVVDIFKEYKDYGMLGLIGTDRFVENANYWAEWDVGATYANNGICQMKIAMEKTNGLTPVVAVDGMCMITQYDVSWREDKFAGFDFYDISQCMEFKKAGYKIGVPYQQEPWCIHDCGPSKLNKYDEYRKIFCEEYALSGYKYQEDEYNVEVKELNISVQDLLKKIHICWEQAGGEYALEQMQDLKQIFGRSGELCFLNTVYEIRELQTRYGIPVFFRIENSSMEDLRKRMIQCKLFLMRLEENFSLDELQDELEYIFQRDGIELDDYYIIAQNACRKPDAVLQKLCLLLESIYGKKTSFCSHKDK